MAGQYYYFNVGFREIRPWSLSFSTIYCKSTKQTRSGKHSLKENWRKIKHCLKEQWFMYNKKIVLWWNFLLSCDEIFLSYNDGVLIVVLTNCGTHIIIVFENW